MPVKTFTNLDTLFVLLDEDRSRADGQVQPWQEQIKPGDKIVSTSHGLLIFGEVLPPAGVTDEDIAKMDPEEAEEVREEIAVYAEPHMRHFRFTRSYSVACPQGELGDVHVSRVLGVLSESGFEKMREAEWDLEKVIGSSSGSSE